MELPRLVEVRQETSARWRKFAWLAAILATERIVVVRVKYP